MRFGIGIIGPEEDFIEIGSSLAVGVELSIANLGNRHLKINRWPVLVVGVFGVSSAKHDVSRSCWHLHENPVGNEVLWNIRGITCTIVTKGGVSRDDGGPNVCEYRSQHALRRMGTLAGFDGVPGTKNREDGAALLGWKTGGWAEREATGSLQE